MAHVVLDTPVNPPSNLPQITRVQLKEVRVHFSPKTINIRVLDQNDDSGIVTLAERSITYSGSDVTEVFQVATEDPENFRLAMDRIIYNRLIADGHVGAGTIT